jgi:adenylyltransferase/sulfurtransferase
MNLSAEEVARYSRHLMIPEVGLEGQLKLKAAKVLCIGAGGLGSPLIMYLAAAGVGTLGIMDPDTVDASNLHRQLLHTSLDVGREKVASASEKVQLINGNVSVKTYSERLTEKNAREICGNYDIIVDGTDNFPTRYLTNDVCVLLGKPNVHASIFRFEGQASVFDAKHGPCYRCLYPEAPPPGAIPSCAEGGVLGILPGLLGLVQATEVIKLITGIGDPLRGRMFMFDALAMRSRDLRIRKNPHCPACGEKAVLKDLESFDYQAFCGIHPPEADTDDLEEISASEAHELMMRSPKDIITLDVRDDHEWQICRIEGARHIPLPKLESGLDSLDQSKTIIVYCLAGGRSKKAQQLLHERGFDRVINMRGGIRAWAHQVDTVMPVY